MALSAADRKAIVGVMLAVERYVLAFAKVLHSRATRVDELPTTSQMRELDEARIGLVDEVARLETS